MTVLIVAVNQGIGVAYKLDGTIRQLAFAVFEERHSMSFDIKVLTGNEPASKGTVKSCVHLHCELMHSKVKPDEKLYRGGLPCLVRAAILMES